MRQPAADAEKQAQEIVGTVFDNSGASHETLKAVMIERIAAALCSRPVGECAWTYDPDGYWQTACGDQFCITEGSPAENRMRYCHCCGRRILTDTEAGIVDSAATTATGEENG